MVLPAIALVAAAAVLTWLARAYALRRNLLDLPGERRSHGVATPRGGGVAVVVVLAVVTLWLAVQWPQSRVLALAFVAGLLLVAGVGMVDDHRPLSPWSRLLVHVVAAGVFALALWAGGAPAWVAGATFALAVVLVNVWNFMDGINGIAATQAALVAALLCAWLPAPWSFAALGLGTACLGFLPYNFPRARIFLGDVGSGSIGFAVAALVGIAATGSTRVSVLLLLPLSAFLVDAGLTLLRRVLRGERWWTAHVQHAYQQWARRAGHPRVTLAYAAWTLAGMAVAWMARGLDLVFILSICAGWYTSAAFAWRRLQQRTQANGEQAEPMSRDNA